MSGLDRIVNQLIKVIDQSRTFASTVASSFLVLFSKGRQL
jgi:hypothetical protein